MKTVSHMVCFYVALSIYFKTLKSGISAETVYCIFFGEMIL